MSKERETIIILSVIIGALLLTVLLLSVKLIQKQSAAATNSSSTLTEGSDTSAEASTEFITASGTESLIDSITESMTESMAESLTESITESLTESLTKSQSDSLITSVETENDTDSADSSATANLASVTIQIDGTWKSDNKTSATENVTIYNNSDEIITDWSLYLTFPSEPVIDALWNGLYTIRDNTVVITAESYNTEIPANDNITLGYNITTDDVEVLSWVIYSGTTQTGSSDSTDEADLSSTTQTSNSDSSSGSKKQSSTATTSTDSPYATHGKLTVTSSGIVDQNGDAFQLKGVSTHGITWFPEYVNKDTFAYLKEDWGANVIRLAMYTDTGDSYGYCSGGDQEEIKELVDTGVAAATELGMYVIIDWHILNDGNPNTHLDDAKEFFAEMSEKYADYGNVIYEIANEPNGGTTWSQVKSYAETIIKIIRKNSPDAVIIVGNPTWCQDIDAVAADPITSADNIIYSVHFYAATHKENLRNKVEAALSSGIPVIISEFGLCDASGSGSIDYDESDAWFDLIEKYNLSYACWSFCNKAETASLISSSCSKTSGFADSELSDSGKYIKKKMQ